MQSSKIFYFSFIMMGVSSILQWCEFSLGGTPVWWTLRAVFLAFFVAHFRIYSRESPQLPILFFLIYIIGAAIAGGLFKTENYWDWKLLIDNFMIFMLPLAAYSVNEERLVAKGINYWLQWAWIPLLLLWPFLESDAFGRYLVPFTFLAIMLPMLNKKWLLALVIAYFITLVYGFESRADVLKFSVCILLGLCLWIPKLNKWLQKLIKPAMWTFLFAPFLFLGLAITGTFNIFEIEKELGLEDKYMMETSVEDRDEVSALADTRTFLYAEEIESSIVGDYYIWGNTPARGYLSLAFGLDTDEDLGTKRGERQSCEVSILNVFNYFGLVGCLLYFIIFITASYQAIYNSENRYIKVIGLYVAFRWLFGFVEDFSRFDLNMMFLWFMIGMCYSKRFRQRTDEEFELWFLFVIYPEQVAIKTQETYIQQCEELDFDSDYEDTTND